MRRTSQAMGYESPRRLVALLATQGQLPPHLNELAPGPVLDYLAALLRQPSEALSSLTVHRHAPSLVLVPKKQQTPRDLRLENDPAVFHVFVAGMPAVPRAGRHPL